MKRSPSASHPSSMEQLHALCLVSSRVWDLKEELMLTAIELTFPSHGNNTFMIHNVSPSLQNRQSFYFEFSWSGHSWHSFCVTCVSTPQITTMCCPTTRRSSVRNPPASAVKAMPVRTTITAKTGGAARTSTNTGAPSRLAKGSCKYLLRRCNCECV